MAAHVTIAGNAYRLRERHELPESLGDLGSRIADLGERRGQLSPQEERELDDRVFSYARAVLDAPADVLARLTHVQVAEVCQRFHDGIFEAENVSPIVH